MTEKKVFYRIKDASMKAGVPAYVFRYWESEFPQLKPRKDKGGQRTYTDKDIKLILQIKDLLYTQGFKIESAKRHLAATGKVKKQTRSADPSPSSSSNAVRNQKEIKKEIQNIKKDLRRIIQSL